MTLLSHLIVPLFNFVLFIIILMALVKKPLRVFLSTRKEMFKNQADDAEKRLQEAKENLARSEDSLRNLEKKLVSLKRSMEIHAMRESEAVTEGAQEKAETLYLEAHRQVTFEMAKLKKHLINDVLGRAMISAESLIKTRLKKEGQGKLAGRSVNLIAKSLNENMVDEGSVN